MSPKPTPLDDIPGYDAWIATARTTQLFQRHLSAALEPMGLEVAHYDVLANVARDEGLSQQVLARRLLVAKSNVSALLSVLERKGLIERVKHASDARVRLVSLTPEGHRITNRAAKAHTRIIKAMLSVVSIEQSQIVGHVMAKITAALDPAPAKVVEATADAADA
jgi:MarR family transcriptional regulator, organic hydroperoxide resistance regulator